MLDISKFDSFFVANWKLNGSMSFVQEYLAKISHKEISQDRKCVVICPPFIFVEKFKIDGLFLGAQNCTNYQKGAYTGEISANMLKNLGCSYCIIGHSERRNIFNEKNETIKEKVSMCIKENIIPILCIGENIKEKEENLTKEIIKKQIEECLPNLSNSKNTIIAYEPIWAIGSGKKPNNNEIFEIHKYIKKNNKSLNFKVLYGGSVNSTNSKDIINLDCVDGLLIGGASLKIEEFNKIIKS